MSDRTEKSWVGRAELRITFLVTNAYGGGGTVRTTLTTAAALAARHEVEVVSVLRHRDEPLLPIDPRIRLRALVDNTPRAAARRRSSRSPVTQTKGLMHSALSRVPSRLAHRQDVRYRVFSARSDLALIRFMRSLSGGVVIGTRPSLNLILARHAPPEVIAIGQEHLHLARHSPQLRQSFLQHYPGLDALVTLTRPDADDYRELLGDATTLLAIPNPLRPPATPTAPGAAHSRSPVIVAAGRLIPQNGFDRLISAFDLVHDKHPDWTLDIHGVGRSEESLRTRIDDKGLSSAVRLRGFSTELEQRFAESAIFALSSRAEGFPMVLLEAMAAGLPVVSFDGRTGPADIIVDGHNGLLVPEGDVEKLAAALNRLIGDPGLRQRMGVAARQRAAEHAPDRIAVRWEALFEQLSLSAGRRTGAGRSRRP
jgi:glycosyltransferase involved in cell wall biosynthesis